MENVNHTYQVLIIGGGPAGIATALTLHARGIRCCVVEALKTPIRKAGEAIPPNAKPLLKQLGILSLLEHEQHTVYYGNKSCWGTEMLEEKEFLADRLGHGFLLNRLFFEQQLQEVYQQTQQAFYKGYKLKKVVSDEAKVRAIVESNSETITLTGDFIIDATGKKASVCRHFQVEKEPLDAQFAITFNCKTTEKLPRQIIVEATENGWWYVAPYAENEVTMMLFTLKTLLPQKHHTEAFLQKEFHKTIHLSQILQKININNFKIVPAGTSCLPIPYGTQWLAVGDAAYSYDPISSYGITSALASGFYAGHAVADYVSGKQDAFLGYRYVVENAFSAYMEKLVNHYTIEKRWQQNHYWLHRLEFIKQDV
ncbi:flavin-dependent dehydrogenase [Kordia periserrulae]|uniref:Flavin-dependent dehydrogenase n=1 Tax=Kordia periserrulae TaxID=701523 RepID=A0A2T6C032_9FLAO|nr:FAD-dependent monooxygenase [Kordia periserrulae]PTX61679.1 flavin-dependent dehydrogenase [Kordia periserrulae]